MDGPIPLSAVIRAVELHRTEMLPGRLGSLKLPHEHLADATGRTLTECAEACEHAMDVGLLAPGKIDAKRYYFTEAGIGMRDEMFAKEKTQRGL